MTSEQNRLAFLKERKTGIGGSDMAAIKGLSKWKTAVSVWLDKTNPEIDPTPSTARQELGNWLEQPLAKWYEEETGRRIQRYTKMLRKGHVIGHIDRLVCPAGKRRAFNGRGQIFTDRFLEVKTSSYASDWEEGVPAYYLDQIHTYFGLVDALQVCDVPYAIVGPGAAMDIKSVVRDDEIAKTQIEFGNWWWDEYVAANKPPPCVSEEDCKRVWYAKEKGIVYTASEIEEESVKRLRAIAEEVERLDGEAGEIRAALENALGMAGADTMKSLDGTTLLTWRQSDGRKTTAWKQVCAEAGIPQEIIDRHTKVGEPFRTFKLVS